jgi:hypothetical protein
MEAKMKRDERKYLTAGETWAAFKYALSRQLIYWPIVLCLHFLYHNELPDFGWSELGWSWLSFQVIGAFLYLDLIYILECRRILRRKED